MKFSARTMLAGMIFAVGFAGTIWGGLLVAERFGIDFRDLPSERRPGGPFALTDHTGKPFTDRNLRGRPALIYFGYSYCPDICPTHLTLIINALDILGQQGASIQPAFVTIDPERDTAEQMGSYAAYFSDRLIGLTGTPKQIAEIADAYGVAYRKVGTDPYTYQMEHSALTFLMAADGSFLTTLTPGMTAEAMAKKIRRFLAKAPQAGSAARP